MWAPPKSLLKRTAANRPLASNELPASDGFFARAPSSAAERTFLIFSPWCDQGLGIQARTYSEWLRDMGHRVVIFACHPSKASSTHPPDKMQADPSEWNPKDVVVVHHAKNREAVPFEDLVRAAQKHHVTDALMLETCHPHIFLLSAALAAQAGVRVFAVPNIEMVRRSELGDLQKMRFHQILCSNQYTYEVLRHFKIPLDKLALFPFAIRDNTDSAQLAALHAQGEPVRFLLVGGMNAERRKQATKVIQAFATAFRTSHGAATLTVLCQGTDVPKLRQRPQNVTIVHQHLAYGQIMQYYAASHVVIMLSRAEGIGLSTYEAMRARCAVLTMETAMFKELIDPAVNGWFIKYQVEQGTEGAKLLGNLDPIVHTYTFDVMALVAAFQAIASDGGSGVSRMQAGARRSFELMFAPERVTEAYARALRTQ